MIVTIMLIMPFSFVIMEQHEDRKPVIKYNFISTRNLSGSAGFGIFSIFWSDKVVKMTRRIAIKLY